MECPKCSKSMTMTHSYRVTYGRTQRYCCSNPKCRCVVTAQTSIVAIDPKYGEGASSLAGRLNKRYKGAREKGRLEAVLHGLAAKNNS